MKIRQRLSDLLFDASKRLVPLEPVRYGVRIVHDEDYCPQTFDWSITSSEEIEAYVEELAKLETGEWVALGMIVVRQCMSCGDVDEAERSTALWGIVVPAAGLAEPETPPEWLYGVGPKHVDLMHIDKITEPTLRETAGFLIAEEQGKADGSIR
jgi:hypothetical protein